MVGTEDQSDLHVHNREAGEHTGLQGVLNTLVDGRNVFLRNHAAGDRVDELVTLFRVGLDFDHAVTVLAAATGLLGVLQVGLAGLRDRFAVGNLRLADVGVHVELADQTVNDDVQMQFAHARDEGLAGFFVALHAEGRVFLRQLVERGGESVTVGLRLGFDGDFDDRFRNIEGFEHHGALFVADRVAGGGKLHAHEGHDVAGAGGLDVLTLVGVHTEQAAKAFLLAGVGVVQRGAGFDHARVDTEEGQVAHEGVGSQLEHETGERFLVRAGADDFFFRLVGVVAHHLIDIERRRQVVHNGVEQRLHADVTERGAAQDGHDALTDGTLADAGIDFLDGQFMAFEVLFHQFFIFFRHGVQQLKALFFVEILEILRDFTIGDLKALGFFFEADGAAIDEVDNAVELVFRTDRDLEADGLRLQAVADHVHAAEEVGADAVHLVDEADTGHAVTVGLAPHGFGLGFHAGDGVEHGHGTVEHAQGTFHFDGEVNVAGGVDDVDLVIKPETSRRGGSDGDTAFLLLRHPVHRSAALVGFADFVVFAGVVQDTFGRRGLTGIDVSHDADVPHFFDRC